MTPQDAALISHSIGVLPSSQILYDGIIDSLKEAGHIDKAEDILEYFKVTPEEWLSKAKALNPLNAKYPAVEGITVYPGSAMCIINEDDTICGYIALSNGTLRSHWSHIHTKHNNKPVIKSKIHERWTPVISQTLIDIRGKQHFYAVDEPAFPLNLPNSIQSQIPNAPSFDSSNPAHLENLTSLFRNQKSSVMKDLDLTIKGDNKTMLPILSDSRISKFIDKYGDLRMPLDPASADPKKAVLYQKLRKAVLRSFLNDCEYFERPERPIHGDVLSLMTNAGRRGESPRKNFSLLTNIKSITAYSIIEAKFIWAMITAEKNTGIFKFNEEQQLLLDNVKKLLQKSTLENIDLVNNLGKFVQSIYFPKDDENYYAQDIFYSPIIAFAALQCWDGSQYLNIFHIPPILAKIQYAIRLRAIPILHDKQTNISSTKAYFE